MSDHAQNTTPVDYRQIQSSPQFQQLRRTFRGFAFPMTALFMAWYLAFVLLSVYAREFMATPVFGQYFNLGHVLGIAQFASTFLITWLYIRHANTKLDPQVAAIRESVGEVSER